MGVRLQQKAPKQEMDAICYMETASVCLRMLGHGRGHQDV